MSGRHVGLEGYDYAHHGRAGTPSTGFVPAGIVDQVCPLGRCPRVWLLSVLASLHLNDALTAASQRGAAILGIATSAGARFESFAEPFSP
ncbi:hypothetical protein ACBJ59_12905 [Nonomuraea sp. MTCD27]|uniref:hypothetical protein n=1 Tax=Nonomuraea sp. MTCD27 TaxID=1676747 RepID=UPI0035BF9A34